MHAKLLQSCLTLCDPVDCSPPGSSVHGILQSRILEWVAMPSSRGSSQPRDGTLFSYRLLHKPVGSLPLAPPGKPIIRYNNNKEVKNTVRPNCWITSWSKHEHVHRARQIPQHNTAPSSLLPVAWELRINGSCSKADHQMALCPVYAK